MDEGVIDISGLDGLLTAVVSGPVVVPPSRWLPAIWGDLEPVWQTKAEFERVFTLMMRHMNSIAAHLMEEPESFEPLFLQRTVDDEVCTIVDEWCEGYRRGVELTEAEWEAHGGEVVGLLGPIYAFTEADGWSGHERGRDEVEELQRAIPAAVREIHACWLARRGDAAPSPVPVQRSGPRVGRNDPCPCGSGRKYKKCCLQ